MCLWSPLLHGFQDAVHHADDGTRVHLTVEAMPGGAGWEWLAWLARSPTRCGHGVASSAESARRLAEDAALDLDRRGSGPLTAPAPESARASGAEALPDRRRAARRHRPVRVPVQAPPVALPGRTLRPPRR